MKRFSTTAWRMAFCLLATCLFTSTGTAQTTYEDYTVTTLAGPAESGPGWQDGSTNVARFGTPSSVAKDAAGNIYVADSLNDTIRKITPDGVVSTIAGLTATPGSTDGIGAAARFNGPNGIAVGTDGTLYVADTGNDTIRKITLDGNVTTLAGVAGVVGATNGPGNTASFSSPYGVMVDQSNTVYVADTFNNLIRVITPAGVVSTLAGKAGVTGSADKTGTAATFSRPVSLAMDGRGNIYVADTANSLIRKIARGAVVSTLAGLAGNPGSADGTNDTARFNGPYGVTVDSADNIYVADTGNSTIRKVTLSGAVTTPIGIAGVTGSTDGLTNQARINSPTGLTAANGTDVIIADFSNSEIRKAIGGTNVITYAGFFGGTGSQNGNGTAARFNAPAGTAVDSAGNIYVADEQNHAIRKITPSGDVSTFAGTMGVVGSHDDTGVNATFNRPLGVAFDPGGDLYVADSRNHAIRKITPDGVVSTFAGRAGVAGTNDGVGANALFNTPFALAIDSQTNVYVSDTLNNTIRKITAAGVVSTLAGLATNVGGTNDGIGSAARFSFPEGIAVDPDGNIFVADNANSTIRKITPDGIVTTFVGAPGSAGSADGTTAARFNIPFGLAIDANRNLFLNDTANHTIRKITPAGVVTTLAGVPGVFGNMDGTGSAARFGRPGGIAVDASGNLYISDEESHVIRKAYPAPPDMPTVDLAAARVGVARHFGIANQTTTSWSWTFLRYPTESSAQLSPTNGASPAFTPDVEDSYLVRFQGWDNAGHTVIRLLTIYADNTAPTIAITNPVSGQISSNGIMTVRGTATDNLGLSNVWVQINNDPWVLATGTTSWSADVLPSNGTNIVRAYAVDLAGNVSATNTVDFRYGAPLLVTLHGGGTVSPNLNGQLLEIGQTYSMTAQAGPGCSFINWTGSLTTTNPTLTFVMDTNLNFTANFTDPIRPTIVITSPSKKGFHASNSVFTATGTASDNGQVAAVYYQLNDGGWIQATNTTNWSAGLTLSQSANTLQAYAVDSLNNASTTNTVAFTYVPSSQMAIFASGQGLPVPNYDGWFLENGKTYSMTAKPAPGYVFWKWTDGFGNTLATSTKFTFTMHTNMAVIMYFTLNPFVSMVGPFAGLFYDTNNISTTNSGSVTLTLAGTGGFSAKGQFSSGAKLSFSGTFAADNTFSNTVAVKGSSPLTVQLRLDGANGGQISGSIGGAGWTSPLFAVRAAFNPVNPAPEHTNKYTLVIPGGNDSTTQPAGNGFGTVSVDASGNVTFSGILGDGSKAAQKTFLNKQGTWPLFVAPYKKKPGAIFGWMTFADLDNSDLNGVLYWLAGPQSSRGYPAGFDFSEGIQAVGSIYSFTNGVPLLNLPSGGEAVLQLGNPVQSYTNAFTLGSDNKITSPDGLNVTITPTSGLFKGTAASLGDGTSVPINGILLQKQNAAYGNFLNNGQSGAVTLEPAQ